MTTTSDALHKFVRARLLATTPLTAIIGDRVYDNVEKGAERPYCVIGQTSMVPETYDCIDMRAHTVQIDCWDRSQGSLVRTRRMTDYVVDALHDATGDLDTHALAEMQVSLVQVFLDADGRTGHGVVQIEAMLERNAS